MKATAGSLLTIPQHSMKATAGSLAYYIIAQYEGHSWFPSLVNTITYIHHAYFLSIAEHMLYGAFTDGNKKRHAS